LYTGLFDVPVETVRPFSFDGGIDAIWC